MDSTDPLEELQRRFCIIDTHGDIRILDRDQINSACNGNYKGDISFYKKFDGELMMKRFLEITGPVIQHRLSLIKNTPLLMTIC